MELLVAMSVATIIIIAVGGFFAATVKATRTDQVSESGMRQGSNVMNALTQYVHAATVLPLTDGTYRAALQRATPTDVAFYAYVNMSGSTAQQPVQVEFVRDPSTGLLLEKQWDGVGDQNGYYAFPALTTAPSRTITLGGPLASPTVDGRNLFVYLDGSGNPIASPAANPGAVRAVQVNVEAGSTVAGTAGNTTLQNTLYLFNVGYATTSTASPAP
ncbi:hypothetical protein MT346_15885 [Curtobacterium sp. VKM Ac-2922]|nr:hypothetical protein [Curtobacterium sp. VKM Ac-2922]MCJ1715667.1 hypothetical protein [Curtobacterium sp. VKM Ac-2922]